MDSLKNRTRVLSMALLAVLVASALRADDKAYFATTGGQFGTIDLTTGATTILGSSSNSPLAGLGEIGGTLYTAGYNAGGTLYTVNPASGALNPVGSSSIIFFALGSTTTGLYAVGWPAGTNTQANPTLYFYSIDPGTAAAKQMGQFGPGLMPGFYAWCLSTGSSTLYFADYENLYAIDTNSGNATLIGGTSQALGGLTFENGKLYATSNSPNTVWTLNPTSGAATMSGSFTNAALAGLAPITPPTTLRFLPQLAFGGGWYTMLYFTNLAASSAFFTVNFLTGTGAPLNIPALNGASANVSLAPRASTSIQIPNTGPLVEGYVTAALPAGVTGYAVFGYTVSGAQPSQEAVVRLSGVTATTSSLIFDETSYTTGVAVVVIGSTGTVNVTAYNLQGATLGTGSIPLGTNGKTALLLRDIPGLSGVAGQLGSIDFSVASGNVAALGIRYNGQAFTSIPTSDR